MAVNQIPQTPLQAPPTGLVPLGNEEWRKWFTSVFDTIGAGHDNTGPQGTFPQLQVGNTTFSTSRDATLGLVSLDQGIYIKRSSSIGNIIYGIACELRRTVGSAFQQFVVGAQLDAIAEKGVSGTYMFGCAIEAWNRPGANCGVIGIEPAAINEFNNNLLAKWAVSVVFKDRSDGAANTVEGLGANRYNYFSKGYVLTGQYKSADGEFASFNVGMDFLTGCLDEETVIVWNNATTYSPGQCVSNGGLVWKCTTTNINVVPPNTAYWVQRTVAGTANPAVGIDFSAIPLNQLGGIASAIRLRDGMVFHWDAVGGIGSFFDFVTGRMVVVHNFTGGGARRFQIDVATGDPWFNGVFPALGGGAAATLGTVGGAGPTAAAQNGWFQIADGAGTKHWIPTWI